MEIEMEALVIAYHQVILKTAYRLLHEKEEARDATQDVFLRLLRHRSDIRGDVCAWLYRVTVNVCNDYHRRRQSTVEITSHTRDAAAPDPERILRIKQEEERIIRALEILTRRERTALILLTFEGISAAEAASLMDVEKSTVRGHIHRARNKLAQHLARSS